MTIVIFLLIKMIMHGCNWKVFFQLKPTILAWQEKRRGNTLNKLWQKNKPLGVIKIASETIKALWLTYRT